MAKRMELPEPPADLALTQEAACFVALKAREFDVKVPPVEADPGSNATDGDMAEILSDDNEDDATATELKDAIEGLNESQRHELVALVWLGRGDAADWNEAIALARDRDAGGTTATYLMGIPRLPDYLEEGLAQIGLSCTEEDIAHSGTPNPRQGIE